MCTTLCVENEHMEAVCIRACWCFYAFWLMCRHVAHFGPMCVGVRERRGFISHNRTRYYRNPHVNHSASASSAYGPGPFAASLSFSLWDRETPSLTNTKTFTVSFHLVPLLIDLNLFIFICSLHTSFTTFSLKSFAAFDFFLPLISLVNCQSFVLHVFISARTHQKHFTTICIGFETSFSER